MNYHLVLIPLLAMWLSGSGLKVRATAIAVQKHWYKKVFKGSKTQDA